MFERLLRLTRMSESKRARTTGGEYLLDVRCFKRANTSPRIQYEVGAPDSAGISLQQNTG